MEPEALEASTKDMWQALDSNQDGVVCVSHCKQLYWLALSWACMLQVTKEEFMNQYVAHSTKLVIRQTAAQLELPQDVIDDIEKEDEIKNVDDTEAVDNTENIEGTSILN